MSVIQIIDRGRGPELPGIRITIFDVLPLFQEGWNLASIAGWFGISSAEVKALQQYFDDHQAEVLTQFQANLERTAKGNSPEVERRRKESRAKLQALRDQLRQQRQPETIHEGHSKGTDHPRNQ